MHAFLATLLTTLLLLPFAAQADLLDGHSLAPVALDDIAREITPGSVLVIGEVHDHDSHHANQRALLAALSQSHANVSAGLEFFEARFQKEVDQFVGGDLSEPDFLKAIRWGGNPFSDYREQALFPRAHAGFTVALNASRELTSRISKVGISGLIESERALLPQGFALGNDTYRARFAEAMGEHVPASAVERYFEAQSTWDDTMASSAEAFLSAHPEQILVVIVGDFHVAWGGGLPDRLRARHQRVSVISQVDVSDIPPAELDVELGAHPRWGRRADWVWATKP